MLDRKFDNMSPEQVYDKIYDDVEEKIKQAKEGMKGSGKDGPPGQTSAPGSPDKQTGTGQKGDMGQDPPPTEAQNDPSRQTGGKEKDLGGSGIGDELGDIPRTIEIDWLHGDLIDPAVTMDDIERQKAESEARQIVHRAALHAQAFGQDTRIAEAFVEDIKPKQPWQEAIQTFVTDLMTMDDYTWKRPRQRYLPQNIYLPSLGGSKDPKLIAIAVDVSGSVSEEMLKEFLAELSSLIHNHPRITYKIYYVDTAIRLEQEITIDNLPIVAQAVGGGGTHFRPAFDRIADQQLPVSGLIYFTDMGASDYGKEPDYPVIWLNFSTPYNPDDESYWRQVPWGMVINMQAQ